MSEAVIVSGVRTAIGNYGGALQDVPAAKLGSIVIKEVLQAFSEEAKTDTENHFVTPDEILIESGTPAEAIVQTAQKQNCDLIVMGTHGHGTISDVFIGSTAKWVVKHSPVPVLVIRLP